MTGSDIQGFYKLSVKERREIVKKFSSLEDNDLSLLDNMGSLGEHLADHMIENVIGVMEVPIGIATNFMINGKDYLIPMAIEEPSVVAAASNAAKMARVKGGFTAISSEPIMIGQIELTGVTDPFSAKFKILSEKSKLLSLANDQDPVLVKVGGGAKDIEVRVLDELNPMVVVHLLVDVRDAMGANAVNTMAEALAPYISSITGGRVRLRILSNLATYRITRAHAIFDAKTIGGDDAVDGIIEAYRFASIDPYRATTHNKGIMNGIDSVLVATANDWRAIEAGAHAYAAMERYTSLTRWERNADGNLVGSIEMPMAVGIVGGATATHPKAKLMRKILGINGAKEFANVLASVGLAQNFAAIRALAMEGIQKGHMELHARNVAVSAGATGNEIDSVAEMMVREKKIRIDVAQEMLEKIRKK
ncbi:MAG: hydroxymethylglutaryl-CoA reductase, degradative [Candidatus Thermoplasmatota archaeon]|jgi:hydroxymethylglutaryl-CoA reductase|nr:hydroxymethylglutaryl-CoA reductase, degradative [Candidatus Thermoplasmatota archaeon]MCL5681260.1 hydroxymethylglutaryl-CoA reductase, degradative [Candidatus Thermoplasmatota archaeon]